MKLWDKGTAAADWVTRFTVGEDWRWDTLLLPYDVEGTRTHAWALAQIDVLTDDELDRIETALDAVRERVAREVLVGAVDDGAHRLVVTAAQLQPEVGGREVVGDEGGHDR